MAEDKIENLAYNPDSYGSGQVLTSTALNNDNAQEQNSINNTLGLIGDLYGDQFSSLFINTLGRSLGSAARLMPQMPDTIDWSSLYQTYGEKKFFSPGGIDDQPLVVTSFELDFVPISMGIVTGSLSGVFSSVSSRTALVDGTYYLEGRVLHFYNELAETVTVTYTPNLYSDIGKYNPKAGLNLIPNVADINILKACTVGEDGGNYYINMPTTIEYVLSFDGATESTGRLASDTLNSTRGITSLDYADVSAELVYGLPKFFLEEAAVSLGGYNSNIPTNAVTVYAVNAGAVTGKAEHDFEFTIATIGGRQVLQLSSASNLDQAWYNSGFQFAIALSSGYSVTHALSTLAQALSQQDHGENGGRAISATSLKNTKPADMGASDLIDSTVPMNLFPQYAHRGGFTKAQQSIEGNAFTGDLRLSTGPTLNTLDMVDFSTSGRTVEWLLDASNTDWTDKLSTATISSVDSFGALKLAMFGDSGSIDSDSAISLWENSRVQLFGATSDSQAGSAIEFRNHTPVGHRAANDTSFVHDTSLYGRLFLGDGGQPTTATSTHTRFIGRGSIPTQGTDVTVGNGNTMIAGATTLLVERAMGLGSSSGVAGGITLGTGFVDSDFNPVEGGQIQTMQIGTFGDVDGSNIYTPRYGYITAATQLGQDPWNNTSATIRLGDGRIERADTDVPNGHTGGVDIRLESQVGFNFRNRRPGGASAQPQIRPISGNQILINEGIHYDVSRGRWVFQGDMQVDGTLTLAGSTNVIKEVALRMTFNFNGIEHVTNLSSLFKPSRRNILNVMVRDSSFATSDVAWRRITIVEDSDDDKYYAVATLHTKTGISQYEGTLDTRVFYYDKA